MKLKNNLLIFIIFQLFMSCSYHRSELIAEKLIQSKCGFIDELLSNELKINILNLSNGECLCVQDIVVENCVERYSKRELESFKNTPIQFELIIKSIIIQKKLDVKSCLGNL